MTYDHIPIGYEVIDSADFAAARLVLSDPTSSEAMRSWAVKMLFYSSLHSDIELYCKEIAERRKRSRPSTVRLSAITTFAVLTLATAVLLVVTFVGYQLGRLGMIWWIGMGEVLQRAAETGGM